MAHLNLHALGLNDVDFVLVAAPNLIVDHSHAADGVMRPTEVHEVVVGQIPLAICTQKDTNTKFKTPDYINVDTKYNY